MKSCLVLIVLFWVGYSSAKANDVFNSKFHFKHIDRSSGLSHNQVHSIFQDSNGFVWVGTISGLNRLDESNVKVFKHSSLDVNSLGDNNILNIWEDHRGVLWLSTYGGLSFFNPITETFKQSDTIKFGRSILNLTNFTNFFKDRDNCIFVMSGLQGVQYGNPKTNEFKQLLHSDADTTTIYSNNVSDIVQNSQGDYWMIHNYGVADLVDKGTFKVKDRVYFSTLKQTSVFFRGVVDQDDNVWFWADNDAMGAFNFNVKTRKLNHFSTKSNELKMASDIVTDILQDNDGNTWIATDHGGISIFNKNTKQLTEINHNPFDPTSISGNSIVDLLKDRNGAIWIGTFKDGVNRYHKDVFRFGLIKDNPIDEYDLGMDDVNCIVSDRIGRLWFGTNGGGLVQYFPNTGEFNHFQNRKSDSNSLSNDVIVSMKVDRENKLWIGTFYGGLNMWDGKQFYHYKHDPDDSKSISDDRVWSIFEDSHQNLWVGTLGGGLNLFDRKQNIFHCYRLNDVNSVPSDYVFAITEDKNGDVWFATSQGLSRYAYDTGRFINYYHDSRDPKSLSSNNVTCLLFDSKNQLWIGTREGLNRFISEENQFETYTTADGLPDSYIVSLIEDDLGTIWVTTPYNLSKLEYSKRNTQSSLSVVTFDSNDGLQSGEFNVNSAYKTPGGEIFIGGTKGVNFFNPKDLTPKQYVGQVIIDDFELLNQKVQTGQLIDGRVILGKAIFKTDEIRLKYKENAFSISYSDLGFLDDNQQFYYKLEGLNNDWIQGDKKNKKVHFTNLTPGEYTFVVRKTNSIESSEFTEAQLKIILAPPFWKTIYAYLFYLLFIVGTLEVLRQMVINRERNKAAKVSDKERERMREEMDLMKMRFFTNISHELKTPLSLILSPIEGLMKEAKDDKQYSQFQMIHRNALRLFNMVNQLLDFRKMDAHQIELNLVDGDLNAFIKDTVDSFVEIASKKEILLSFENSGYQLFTSFDRRKIERIMFNLLSNAFKFTPGNGTITISTSIVSVSQFPQQKFEAQYSNLIAIRVKDTGVGIHPDNQHRVFERFFQEHTAKATYNEGSGIGLSIALEFAQIHGGTILLESIPNQGTTFTVLIPLIEVTPKVLSSEAELDDEADNEAYAGPSILIIDDNDDFRAYIKQGLEDDYRVYEASNGDEGLKKAINFLPDLVISDIMMPIIDGIELCRQLKSDLRTSHIPIILLTAVNNQQKMLDGFEIGADDYMTKPFNPEILASRIKNLIGQREKLHKNFKLQMKMTPKDVQVTSLDERLINKAIEVVEQNIANPDFSVADLSQELGMSRVNLYKKLKSLTGHTPIEFIRAFRIKRAAQLLSQSHMGVSEVAYQVGFNDPRYFTRYFKAEFKVLPSEFAKRSRLKSETDSEDSFREI